jgi:hypothetical protein
MCAYSANRGYQKVSSRLFIFRYVCSIELEYQITFGLSNYAEQIAFQTYLGIKRLDQAMGLVRRDI